MTVKPIKICALSLRAYQYFNPAIDTKGGGAELQLYYFTTELAKDNNFAVYFIVSDFGQPEGEVREGVTLMKLKAPTGLKFLRVANYFFRFWRLISNIDADVYVQRAVGVETLVVGLFCKITGKKFIYMVAHDEDVINRKPSWMQQGVRKWLEWRLFSIGLKSADLVLTQNQRQAENLRRYYGKVSITRRAAQRIPQELDSSQKENFVLFVARCEKFKRPEVMIGLARNMADVQFTMVCPVSSDPDFFKVISEAASRMQNIRFLSSLASDAYDEYFLKAKVHLNTSRVEGFPNTYIQALKYKTPVVSLNVNPDHILTSNDIGRCADNDVVKLEQHLREVLARDEVWKRLSENAYRYVKSNHDIQRIINDDKKCIYSIVNSKQPTMHTMKIVLG